MLKTRNRIVNFRVTEDEFMRMRTASIDKGSRCLSDYARDAILKTLEGYNHDHPLGDGNGKDEMHLLVQRLGLVEQNMAKLQSLVSGLAPNEHNRNGFGSTV
jgi:hypothetical protein